jgi:hypothetical protein
MLVKPESFVVTRGTPKLWRQIDSGGTKNAHWFCVNCGGGIADEKNAHPNAIAVHAGTLDDTSWIRPIAHVHLCHAQAWQRIPNNTVCFETMPNDLETLSSQWQGLWQSVKWVTA